MPVEPIIPPQFVNRLQQAKVWLVGSGPGDPELLTLRALRAINEADLILYDRLVSQEIRALFPEETLSLFVGKAKGHHCVPQDRLNQMLVEYAQRGLKVCRLKAGDPFVFGRGGEEALVLAENKVNFEIVPGVTAAAGCTAYSGIPLTHRGMAQACTFVTGHGETALELDWRSLSKPNQTVVFYMGLSKLFHIQEKLLTEGASADLPVAIIENGCRHDQRTVTGKLSQLSELAQQHRLESPSLIVIGEVVTLSESLNWYGQLINRQAYNSSTEFLQQRLSA